VPGVVGGIGGEDNPGCGAQAGGIERRTVSGFDVGT
jgi:hypothetical protein